MVSDALASFQNSLKMAALRLLILMWCCWYVQLGHAFYDEKAAAICGQTDWFKKYTQRHDDMLAGHIPAKFMISFPVKAGLADMILGYVSAFVWALLTDRVFLILRVPNLDGMCNQRTIEFAYEPRFADWSAAISLEKKDFECMLPPYPEKIECTDTDEHPSLVSFRYSNGTMSPPTNTLRHMRKVCDGYRNEFKNKDMTKYPEHIHDSNILMFSNNWGTSYNAFNNPNHHEALAKLGFTNENLFPCVFDFLFKMKHEVCTDGCKEVEHNLHALGHSDNKTVRIGIHVRNENAAEAPQHFHCAEELIADIKSKGLDYIILLVTASVTLQQSMLNKYGSKLLLPNGKVDGVVGVHRGETNNVTPEGNSNTVGIFVLSQHDINWILSLRTECARKAREDERAIVDSARDMHLLSLTDIHIFSSSSGFGVVSAMMKPK
jgi:hypothetical protein